MSRENVEAFRRGIAAFNDRSVQGMMDVLDRSVVFSPVLAGVTDTRYRGEEGVREFLAATDEAFERFHLHCERVEDHGDFVLAVNEAHARGRVSGAAIRQPLVQIAEFRDGKCVRFRSFRTPEEALEAAGLSEWATSQGNVARSRVAPTATRGASNALRADHSNAQARDLRAVSRSVHAERGPREPAPGVCSLQHGSECRES